LGWATIPFPGGELGLHHDTINAILGDRLALVLGVGLPGHF
jgi:hypothetical protein